MEDFDRMNRLISSIVIPIGLLGFVVPCIILVCTFNSLQHNNPIHIHIAQICCCVPSCPLSRRRERGGMVHGGQSNGNRSTSLENVSKYTHVCAASILILGRARIILHLAFNILDKQQVWWSATGVPGRGKHHNDNVSAPAANNNISAPAPDNKISAPAAGQHQLPPPTTPALPCSSPSLL